MARQSLHGVLQHMRSLAAVQTYRKLSDRALLERFALAHDETAFTVLIERHGPMVLGVCRRALANFHDAEDACQATFLVLARKAASIRKKTSLTSWLYGVACRLAANLKRDQMRRKSRERAVDQPAPQDPAAEVTWREVQAIFDEELERLPERYRGPVILCYLQCLTRDEAAQQLGLSPGSLHGRLERARDLLRQRLTKRGLTLSAVMSATALGEGMACSAVAPTLVVSSTKAAMLLAAGQPLPESVVATQVLILTQEVLKNMFLTQLKLGTAAVLCAGLFAALVVGSFTSLATAQDASSPTSQGQRLAVARAESDLEFIRRISKDLRDANPTPAEIHFFVASTDEGKRQKIIDLFIQERQAKKDAAASDKLAQRLQDLLIEARRTEYSKQQAQSSLQWGKLGSLQKGNYEELAKANEKGAVAKITQAYLDHLTDFVKTYPDNQDVAEAIRQIALLYEWQGKLAEARAWRDKLPKEDLKSSTKDLIGEAVLGKTLRQSIKLADRSVVSTVSPDGRLTAAAQDKSFTILDTATLKVYARCQGHSEDISSLAFAPDGKLIASGGKDKAIIFWDVPTGRQVRRIRVNKPVETMTFSNDGKFLVIRADGQTMEVDLTKGLILDAKSEGK